MPLCRRQLFESHGSYTYHKTVVSSCDRVMGIKANVETIQRLSSSEAAAQQKRKDNAKEKEVRIMAEAIKQEQQGESSKSAGKK
ncbi:MAG: hypothetical protein M1837_002523 [Sclerophora amabilis]|nr:MAG: hypothetical protein M1837_002523 [Sclerophora amabilis]